MKISPFKLNFSLIILAATTSMLQAHAATKYFASECTMIGEYEVPRDCSVQYQKSTTETISLFSPAYELMGHVEIKYFITDGKVEQGYIPELEVSPAYQRKGLGSLLFNIAVHKLADEQGVSAILWEACPFKSNISLRALEAFYLKNGGEIRSRIQGCTAMHLNPATLSIIQKKSIAQQALPSNCSLKITTTTEYEFWLRDNTSTTLGSHCAFTAKQFNDPSDGWFMNTKSVRSPLGAHQYDLFEKCMIECIEKNIL